MNLSRLATLAIFFMIIMSAFVAIPTYNVGADEHEDDDGDEGPQPESFHATMTMDSLEDWTVDYYAEMDIEDSDEMREGLAGMCADMMGTDDGEINDDCFNYWLSMMNSDGGGDNAGDGMGCPPGLTEPQCDNFMSCFDEDGDIVCPMLEFQRNLYNICNDDDSHEFCYLDEADDGRAMFNAAFKYEDGELSAEDFMELIVDSMFGDDTGMGMEEMYVIYDAEFITIGAEDEGEYVIETDGECYQVEEDEWECFYPHYVMLMDGNDDIVAIKQEYCDWDSDNIENVDCDSEIRVDLSEGTYNLVTATGCYNEWNETTEEMGDLICDSTGKYNYTMYWAEDMTENRNILGSIDDDSTVNEFDYMDYIELQGDYGFAPVYETYEFNVGPDGFKGVIDSYQYRWENDCEEDCESDANMILWMYVYSFNPNNTVDNLMAVSGHNDFYDDENDEYYCCYSMLDLELTEGTYVFVMSGDYTHMISDDWSTLYHDTVISEYDDEGGANDLEWYGTLDSNDSRAYFPSNYYDYEDRGDDNGDDDEMWLFMAMIENVTAYQDGDITAVEAANNFIDLMYVADAMGLYDDNDGDGDDMYWESWNYCEWEGDDWDGGTMWYCTDNDNGNDGFDDWWYYCEMHDDGVGGSNYYCTDDFGQSPDYEFSASNDHYVTGGSPDGGNGGEGDCPFSDYDLCYDVGPYCDDNSPVYDPEYCGAESAHYCAEDGEGDGGCEWIAMGCDAGEIPGELCDAFLNFDHAAYHDGDDEDDHARLDGIIGTENPPNNIPVISSTNFVGALSDNEGLPMMYTGSFKLNFEGVDASLEIHEAYIPVDDGTWHVEMILLEGYDVKSCEGCENLVIEGSNAKFDADEPVTVIFGKVADTSDCDAIVTVGAGGYSFEPAEITIAAGDTVCWIWDTTDVHNVAEIVTKFDADMNLEDAKIGFNSGEPINRLDFRHTFEENDKTHYYVCEPHATMAMVGTVTVGNGTAEDPIQEIAEESGLPSIGFVVGALALVGAAGLHRRIR